MAADLFYAYLDYSPCQNLRLDLEVPTPSLDILEQLLCVPSVVATVQLENKMHVTKRANQLLVPGIPTQAV